MTPNPFFPLLRVFAAKSPVTFVCQVSTSFAGALFVLALAILDGGTSGPTASAQAVTFTGSGAVNFGSANVCSSGKTAPAPCSQTLTLTYDVTASGTLGTPLALTTGAPDLDYKLASGSTCSGSVVKGSNCKVNVTFAPIAPGARNGAVEIVDGSGEVLSTTYIYGTGSGSALAFSPSTSVQIQLAGSFDDPLGVAVDASGNIFVADYYHGVTEILAAGGYTTANTLGSGFDECQGVAVDGAGNVFVGDTGNNAVKEILRAGGYTTVKSLASGFRYPRGLAVDGSGNVFVADSSNDAVKEILAAGGYTTVKTLGSGFDTPEGVVLDAAGNVFVADTYNFAIKEITAGSGYSTVKTLRGGYSFPTGLAVDASGNVYVADFAAETVSEILAAGGYATVDVLSKSVPFPNGVAVDPTGNVFIVDGNFESWITELTRPQPPLLDFGHTNVGAKSSPLTATVQNIGNTDLVGTSLTVSPNWDQVAGSGTPEDCTASFSLAPSAECNLSVSFEPTEAGSLTGAVTLTDNALNETGASQSIALSGTGDETVPPEITGLNTTYGAPYSVVILDGTNFGATQGSSTVTFNGVATPHYHWSDTQIYVTVPPNATTGNLVVTVDGKASNAVAFTVVPQPKITGMSPTSGPVGTVVTISGTGLLDYGFNLKVTSPDWPKERSSIHR